MVEEKTDSLADKYMLQLRVIFIFHRMIALDNIKSSKFFLSNLFIILSFLFSSNNRIHKRTRIVITKIFSESHCEPKKFTTSPVKRQKLKWIFHPNKFYFVFVVFVKISTLVSTSGWPSEG